MAVTVFDTVIPMTRFPGGIAQHQQNLTGSTDAIVLYAGSVWINSTGIDACTLAQPIAGVTDQNLTGQDEMEITIVDTGGHAHTVTCATNGIVPSHHLITFNGTAGSWVRLRARNALWYPVGSSGVTIS